MDINQKIDTLTNNLIQLLDYIESNENLSITTINKIKYLDPLFTRFRNLAKVKESQNKNFNTIKKNTYCYMCKIQTLCNVSMHNLYNNMCWLCGNINHAKRELKKDMSGKIAIVTGGRIKIGFETAIRLLKNGCIVIVTTRFCDDCLERYQKDTEFNKFKDRLFIYQLNMLNGQNINKFIKYVFDTFPKIDILINNSAQTLKRPREFFQHVIDKKDTLTESVQIVYQDQEEFKYLIEMNNHTVSGSNFLVNMKNPSVTGLTILDKKQAITELFPCGSFDQFGQQMDLRKKNSWVLEAPEISTNELAEVYIINSIAPFMLTNGLKDLMKRSDSSYSWVINVTSMEGVFNWNSKPSTHCHTNMAKAALNMFTRTCGQYYIKYNIVMSCVDTGWNNIQQPDSYHISSPIDCIDGASRILYPIFTELKKHSVLFKDYEPHPW